MKDGFIDSFTYVIHKVKETKEVTDLYSHYDTFGKFDLIYEILGEIKYVTYNRGAFYDEETGEKIDSISKYNSALHKILYELAEVDLDVYSFVRETERFQRISK